MNRWEYYQYLKKRAREIRAQFGLTTPKVGRAEMRRIYRAHGIKIDKSPLAKNILGAYFNDENGVSVLINSNLPIEPTIFTMGHELKHHLEDRVSTLKNCTDGEIDDPIEIGAGVFSAELIFPESDFIIWLDKKKVPFGKCTPTDIVRMKHETQTTISYSSLKKRAVYLGYAGEDIFRGVKWITLAESIYGIPFHKRFKRFTAKGNGQIGRVPFPA